MPQPLHQLTATEIVRAIAAGKATATAVAESCLARIAAREPEVGAWEFLDRDLVLRQAMHAKAAGVRGFVAVSSVGADMASRNFYLRTKGEMEAGLEKIGFARLDVLRPGLLPVSTSRYSATSSTERAMMPSVSTDPAASITPAMRRSPQVGR